MFEIIIKQPGKKDAKGKLIPGVYRVGSEQACHIQFQRPEISKVHARLTVSDKLIKIEDMQSSNGTFLDGKKINEAVEAYPGSTLKIGDVEFYLKGSENNTSQSNTQKVVGTPGLLGSKAKKKMTSQLKAAHAEVKEKKSSEPVKSKKGKESYEEIPILKISGISLKARPLVQEIKRRAHMELLKRLNLKRMAVSGTSEEELAEKAKSTIHEILSELSIPLPKGVNGKIVKKELVHEAVGLGPLEDLIEMTDITEIMVNGPNQVFVESDGVLFKTDTAFADDNQVLAAIERIVSPLGRRIDESSPMVDARLKDGSRVNAIIPPLSLVGPSITIRKFSKDPLTVDNLVDFNSISYDIAHFLEICVQLRKNILISGGTGSGKTTLLNILSSFLPNTERIISIEDAAELQMRQDHVVRLESRPPNIEGKGQISIRDLVKNALRMRPDRIVVGECRGGEALDMLQAMNTGHDGSLTTIHANSPRDALARLETLVLMAGFDLPLKAIREQIASAVALIVQINREKDGSRKLIKVSEITKMEGEMITMQDIFIFKQEGWNDKNKIVGDFVPTGNIPTFMDDIKRAKLDLNISMFTKNGIGEI